VEGPLLDHSDDENERGFSDLSVGSHQTCNAEAKIVIGRRRALISVDRSGITSRTALFDAAGLWRMQESADSGSRPEDSEISTAWHFRPLNACFWALALHLFLLASWRPSARRNDPISIRS
jgi:hypothetical protein